MNKTVLLVAQVGVAIAAAALLWAVTHPCDCEKTEADSAVEVEV